MLSLFARLHSDSKSFDVHRLAFLPATRGHLRDLSELLEQQTASMRANDATCEDAIAAARRFNELNRDAGTGDDGAEVTARLQEALAIAYAQQVLLRSCRGLRVTFCGKSLPFARGTDVGAVVQSALANGGEGTSKAA